MSRMPTRPPDDVTVLVLRRLPDSSVRRPLGAVVDGRGDVAPLDDNWL